MLGLHVTAKSAYMSSIVKSIIYQYGHSSDAKKSKFKISVACYSWARKSTYTSHFSSEKMKDPSMYGLQSQDIKLRARDNTMIQAYLLTHLYAPLSPNACHSHCSQLDDMSLLIVIMQYQIKQRYQWDFRIDRWDNMIYCKTDESTSRTCQKKRIRPTVITFHGNDENIGSKLPLQTARTFFQLGCHVLMLSYRGWVSCPS